MTRLNSLVRCLKKSPELATEYSKVIEDQKKQGIIEEFNPFWEKAEVGKTHYTSVIMLLYVKMPLLLRFELCSMAVPNVTLACHL